MSAPQRTGRSESWFALTHLSGTLLLGVLLLLTAALLGRPDVAALGVAPLLVAAWGWGTRPTERLTVELRTAEELTADRELAVLVRVAAPPGAPALRVRASSPGTEPHEAVVAVRPGQCRDLTVATTSVRTGENVLFRVDAAGLGADLTTASDLVTVGPATVLVLPGRESLVRLPLPRRLQGLVGPHHSRRIGDGTELHDVAPFAPGVRLRRIDWRTSARRGMHGDRLQELYVRRTQADADATVMLVVDSRDEVGPDVMTWAGAYPTLRTDPTSLDVARQAAASLARAYLTQGDRVGLEDLGRRQRPVPPSGGRRHLDRIVRRLALCAPDPSVHPRRRAPLLPSGALVVVLSTFLDDDAATLALTWRHCGHRVIAVDVLPPLRTAHLRPRMLLAYRMVTMQREDRLTTLRRGGAEVVRWAPDGPPPTGGPARVAALARNRHGGPR